MVLDRKLKLYKCPKCSAIEWNSGILIQKHGGKCGTRREQFETMCGYYDIPAGFGELNSRETLISSLAKTQIPWNDDTGMWYDVMWDYDLIPGQAIVNMMKSTPVFAAIEFFDRFLHKDAALMKCKNFIRHGNTILEIRHRETGVPSSGVEVVTHPRNETTLRLIAMYILEKVCLYVSRGPPGNQYDYIGAADLGKFRERLMEVWVKKAIPGSTGTQEMQTAVDIFTQKIYNNALDPLKEHIRAKLPTKDHIRHNVMINNEEIYNPITKTPDTFRAWVCRGCRYSTPYKSKIKTHINTCIARPPNGPKPNIFAVLTKYEMTRPEEGQVGWSDNINEQADALDHFMRTHLSICSIGERDSDVINMSETLYESIFKKDTIEDVIVSVWSHFFGRRAIKSTYCSCFRTVSSVYIYTTKYNPIMPRNDPFMVHETLNSADGRRLILLEMRERVLEFIRINGTTPEEHLTEREKKGKREMIARRNVYLLDRKMCPDMDTAWSNADLSRVNFEPRSYPNLRKFVDRLIGEIPYIDEVQMATT